ncbi:hypothetical protein DICA2_C15016 [Diutina catenulata]
MNIDTSEVVGDQSINPDEVLNPPRQVTVEKEEKITDSLRQLQGLGHHRLNDDTVPDIQGRTAPAAPPTGYNPGDHSGTAPNQPPGPEGMTDEQKRALHGQTAQKGDTIKTPGMESNVYAKGVKREDRGHGQRYDGPVQPASRSSSSQQRSSSSHQPSQSHSQPSQSQSQPSRQSSSQQPTSSSKTLDPRTKRTSPPQMPDPTVELGQNGPQEPVRVASRSASVRSGSNGNRVPSSPVPPVPQSPIVGQAPQSPVPSAQVPPVPGKAGSRSSRGLGLSSSEESEIDGGIPRDSQAAGEHLGSNNPFKPGLSAPYQAQSSASVATLKAGEAGEVSQGKSQASQAKSQAQNQVHQGQNQAQNSALSQNQAHNSSQNQAHNSSQSQVRNQPQSQPSQPELVSSRDGVYNLHGSSHVQSQALKAAPGQTVTPQGYAVSSPVQDKTRETVAILGTPGAAPVARQSQDVSAEQLHRERDPVSAPSDKPGLTSAPPAPVSAPTARREKQTDKERALNGQSATSQSANGSQTNSQANQAVSSQNPQKGQVQENAAVAASPDTPSANLDMTGIKTKPPARKAGEPTFRGWKEVGRFESKDAMTAEDQLTDLTSKPSLFDNYLPSMIFGEWYHNVAWLCLGSFLSWFFGYFRFGLGPVFFVVITSCIVYRSSVRKYRGELREEAEREFSIKSIETDYETMDWFNVMVEKFWYFLEPSISQIVCEQVNAMIITYPIPGFIKQVWIDTFTAGTKPFRIEKVKTLAGTSDDVVVMDWGFSFTPNALVDSNAKQLKSHVNQKTVVKASLFGLSIPVSVSDVSCYAVARIRIRMMESFPHIETVSVSMMEPPKFDFCARLGENTPEVLNLPGLYGLINEMVKKYAGPMLFTPMSYQLNVQQLMAGNALDSAVGVLEIKVKNGRHISSSRQIGNTMDPYLKMAFDKKKILATTTTKMDTADPSWNETFYIPVKSLADPLLIACYDYNDVRSDKQVGIVQMDLEMLEKQPQQDHIVQTLTSNSRPVGELSFGLKYMKCLEATLAADGAFTPPPDLDTGIARINVAEGRHLKLEGSDKPPNVQVEVYLNGELVDESAFVNSATPGWNLVTEKIIPSRSKAKVKVVVKDKSGKKLGVVNKYMNEYIDASQVEQSWFSLAKGGEIRVELQWKPVELDIGTPVVYTPPIGAVRVSIEKAEDLRNLETIGKVDPYCRLMVNGVVKGRTRAFNGRLNPTWNEVHYITVSSANQKLTMEVMDVERHSPDRTLGSFDVRLNEIIQRDERGQYIEHQDQTKRVSKLIHKKGVKGSVTYSLSFFPCLPVMTTQDIEDEKEEKEKEQKEKEKLQELQRRADELEQKMESHHRGPRHHQAKVELQKVHKQMEGRKDDSDLEVDGGDDGSTKLRMSLEELCEFKSGVFVFDVEESSLQKDDCYVQMFFGNSGHPDFVSQKLKRKGKQKICSTADTVLTDLEWAQVNIRVASKKDNNRAEKAICEGNFPALQLLKNAYHEPETLQLSGGSEGSVTLSCQWIPLIYEKGVPPQDSKDNSGDLKITLLRGEGLPAADSNGKSDPFCELYLNSDRKPFFKSNKKKKTLDPNWNENTEIELGNKYDTEINVTCWDWDMAGENDLLGTGVVKLCEADTSDGKTVEVKCPLTGESGEEAGHVYFKFSFEPRTVYNVRPNSETTVGDAFGDIGKGGATVVKGVGKGVGKGVKGVGTKVIGGGFKGVKGLFKHDKDDDAA